MNEQMNECYNSLVLSTVHYLVLPLTVNFDLTEMTKYTDLFVYLIRMFVYVWYVLCVCMLRIYFLPKSYMSLTSLTNVFKC